MKKTFFKFAVCLLVIVSILPMSSAAFASAEDNVAVVIAGGKEAHYSSLQQAFNEASANAVIKLLKNVPISASDDTKHAIKVTGKALTLDLNGYTITVDESYGFSVDGSAAQLTVKDSSSGSAGKIETKEKSSTTEVQSAFEVRRGAKLELCDGVEISSNGSCVWVRESSTLTTKADLTTTTSYATIATWEDAPTINVAGGNVTSKNDIAIWLRADGTLNITGGTITGTTGVYVQNGTLKVSGLPTIQGTGEKKDIDWNDKDSVYATGNAIVIENRDDEPPKVSIQSGTFQSRNAAAIASYADTDKTVVSGFISGGRLKGYDATDASLIANGHISVGNTSSATVQQQNNTIISSSGENIAIEEVPAVDIPQTGDSSNLALVLAMLLLSSGAAVGLTMYGRKKKRYN